MEPVLQYFQIVNVLFVLIPPVKIQGLDKLLTLNLEPRIRNKLRYLQLYNFKYKPQVCLYSNKLRICFNTIQYTEVYDLMFKLEQQLDHAYMIPQSPIV